jgi:alkanesulfonate monooxygenase SsuD/methylene tetrahydromethanopterin reductase-like flavin-dependent oxidoreductase (luciferase family)
MGGTADPVLRRIARMADGWIPIWRQNPEEKIREHLVKLYEYAEAEGRDSDDIGIHGLLPWLDTFDQDVLVDHVETWEELGADYLSVGMLGQGFDPDEHIQAIERFAAILDGAGIDLVG